jgi:hypothetical protein
MRIMTELEQEKLLKVIASELFGTSMINMDDILYSSVERIMEAIPSDIREQYNLSLRKAKADKLRKQADMIECGGTNGTI